MPKFEGSPVYIGSGPLRQTTIYDLPVPTTIYDLPVLDLIPTTINTEDTMKKPLLKNPDMERSYHGDKDKDKETWHHDDSDEGCCDCDSCCDGVCSDESLCLCLCCCCMCEEN